MGECIFQVGSWEGLTPCCAVYYQGACIYIDGQTGKPFEMTIQQAEARIVRRVEELLPKEERLVEKIGEWNHAVRV
jgi:hypothetical protein